MFPQLQLRRTYLKPTAMVDNRRSIAVTTRNMGCLDPFEVLRFGPSPSPFIVTQIQQVLNDGRLLAYMVQSRHLVNNKQHRSHAIIASEFVDALLLHHWTA